MKVFATGRIPVHIALSLAHDEDERFSASAIRREMESCYKQYTPAQSIPVIHEDAKQIQRETDMSWNIYMFDQACENLSQLNADLDDAPVIRAYLEGIDDIEIPSVEIQLIATSPRAIRRKKNAKHNQHMRTAAIIDYKGAASRFDIDNHYKAIVNRRIVTSPKSRSLRFAKLLKRVKKKKLLTIDELAATS